jgi:hypothetical protein
VNTNSGWYTSHDTGQKTGNDKVQKRISNCTPMTRYVQRLTSPAMERTELMDVEEANRITTGRLPSHRPEGECRRLPDDRMLWKRDNLMRFATFPTINSVLSNADELR